MPCIGHWGVGLEQVGADTVVGGWLCPVLSMVLDGEGPLCW